MSTFPYIAVQGAVAQTFLQLRKGFPSKVDAGYLKRLRIAPANESYIISILRFLGLIDEDGQQQEAATDFFFRDDEAFKAGLEERLRDAYAQLFDDLGDDALTADREALTNWFRAADRTSELVGQRQASTFLTLRALAGHGQPPAIRTTTRTKGAAASTSNAKAKRSPSAGNRGQSSSKEEPVVHASTPSPESSGVGLTVRIEVNLPPGGDASTYDAIFASIKKHLMT